MSRRALILPAIGLAAALRCLAIGGVFSPVPIPGTDIQVLPESEREFRRLIIGLGMNETQYFMLPSTEHFSSRTRNPQVLKLRRELYKLNFELIHGQIMKAAPTYASFYLAVPDTETNPESLGDEEEIFREYLASRVGWSPQEIAKRAHFFTVSAAVEYPQDMAEILGHDSKGRLVLGVGSDSENWYKEPVQRLGKLFQQDFVVRELGGIRLGQINTEGGDLSLVWLPEGKVGLLLGRHRVVRYLERHRGQSLEDRPLTAADIEEVKAAYRKAFFGLEVLVVPEAALKDPSLASPELFHLDMTVNVLRGSKGIYAFVPTYAGEVVDAVSRTLLDAEVTARAQKEYDLVANQLAKRGYAVVRLPFSDHPVRAPVGASRFTDPAAHRPYVVLGKYPYHKNPRPGARSPQARLQEVFHALEAKVDGWRADPSVARWQSVEAGLRDCWAALDRAAAAPNPEFAEQARIFQERGIDVLAVPIFPTGSGGLHCSLLK